MSTTLSSLKETLIVFKKFIKGDSLESLSAHMKKYDKHPKLLKKHFHSTHIHDLRIKDEIAAILKNLNLYTPDWHNQYSNTTVYEFLCQLVQERQAQVSYIIKAIDEKNKTTKLLIAFGLYAALALLIGLGIAITAYPSLLPLLISFAYSVAVYTPIISLISTCSAALWYLYQNYADKTKSTAQKITSSFFIIAHAACQITAYSILISGVLAAANPVSASFFVAATLVNVIKEIVDLIHIAHHRSQLSPLKENRHLSLVPWKDISTQINMHIHFDYARREYGFQKSVVSVAINIAAAVLLAGVVATWCFAPSGIILTCSAIAAMVIVIPTVKNCLLALNEKIFGKLLQNKLKHLEQRYTNNGKRPFSPTEIFDPAVLADELTSTTDDLSSIIGAYEDDSVEPPLVIIDNMAAPQEPINEATKPAPANTGLSSSIYSFLTKLGTENNKNKIATSKEPNNDDCFADSLNNL